LDEVASFIPDHVGRQAQLDAPYVVYAGETLAARFDFGGMCGSHVHDRRNRELVPDVCVVADDGIDTRVGQAGVEQHSPREMYDAGRRGTGPGPGRDRADHDGTERVTVDQIAIFATETEATGRGHHRIEKGETGLVVGRQIDPSHRSLSRSNTGPVVQASRGPR
jgi:hypothetical protein